MNDVFKAIENLPHWQELIVMILIGVNIGGLIALAITSVLWPFFSLAEIKRLVRRLIECDYELTNGEIERIADEVANKLKGEST